jgi:hypothetical protein
MSQSPEGSTGRFWKWFIPSFFTTVFAVIGLMTQTGADDATKNLQSYADKYHLAWPQWLTANQVMSVLGLLVVASFVYAFRGALRPLPGRLMAAYRVLRGLPPAPPAPPTPYEIVALNDVRAAFNNYASHAANKILSLCLDAQNDEHGQGVTFAWLVEEEKKELRDAKARLDAALDPRARVAFHILRFTFLDFLAKYGTVVRIVHDYEREGVDLLDKQHVQAYQDWEGYHADLWKRLNDMKEQEPLTQMGPVLQQKFYLGEGLRYASLRARADKMFRTGSPDQRAFLRLFSVETTPSQDNPIEGKIYNAGMGLTRDRLLKLEHGEGGARWFSLPAPVVQAWLFTGQGALVRERVLIPPSAVIYPMDPGGGVTG